jgi:glycerol-3-phosphate dehydrogenase
LTSTDSTPRNGAQRVFDLLVIGGGINGVGIARDAAGRARTAADVRWRRTKAGLHMTNEQRMTVEKYLSGRAFG